MLKKSRSRPRNALPDDTYIDTFRACDLAIPSAARDQREQMSVATSQTRQRDVNVDPAIRNLRLGRDVSRDIQRDQPSIVPPPVDSDVPSDAVQPCHALRANR